MHIKKYTRKVYRALKKHLQIGYSKYDVQTMPFYGAKLL